MFSASHQIFLNNKLVEDISMFNVGGIFEAINNASSSCCSQATLAVAARTKATLIEIELIDKYCMATVFIGQYYSYINPYID